MTSRPAKLEDAEAIARIYNEGIEDRIATFETRLRSAEDIRAWFDGRHPIVVVEEGNEVVAFAATSSYRPRECYAGIAETSVYVVRSFRRPPANPRNEAHLSTREIEVLSLLSHGLSNKEIADQMRLSVETVRSYLKTIYEKLHVRCRMEAVIRYQANRPASG